MCTSQMNGQGGMIAQAELPGCLAHGCCAVGAGSPGMTVVMAPLKEPGHLQSAVNVNTALQCAEGTSNYADGAAGKCIDLASSMAWRAPYEQEQSLQHAIICSRESTHCNKRDGLRNLKRFCGFLPLSSAPAGLLLHAHMACLKHQLGCEPRRHAMLACRLDMSLALLYLATMLHKNGQMQYIGPHDDPKGWPPLARSAASTAAAPFTTQLTPELLCMLQLILQLMTRDILQNPCLQHKLPGVDACLHHWLSRPICLLQLTPGLMCLWQLMTGCHLAQLALPLLAQEDVRAKAGVARLGAAGARTPVKGTALPGRHTAKPQQLQIIKQWVACIYRGSSSLQGLRLHTRTGFTVRTAVTMTGAGPRLAGAMADHRLLGMQRFSLHEPRLQNTARHPGLVMALFKQRFTSVFVKAAGQCRLSNCMRLPRCTVLKSVPMSLQRKSHGFQPVALQGSQREAGPVQGLVPPQQAWHNRRVAATSQQALLAAERPPTDTPAQGLQGVSQAHAGQAHMPGGDAFPNEQTQQAGHGRSGHHLPDRQQQQPGQGPIALQAGRSCVSWQASLEQRQWRQPAPQQQPATAQLAGRGIEVAERRSGGLGRGGGGPWRQAGPWAGPGCPHVQCTLLRIVYTSGMLAAHDCRTALGQLPPGCLPRHLGPVLACQPDCGGDHSRAVTSQAVAQDLKLTHQHYQQLQGRLQPPQLHQGATAGARHPVAMGSHVGAGLPHAGQVNVLPTGFAGQTHHGGFLICLHRQTPAPVVGLSLDTQHAVPSDYCKPLEDEETAFTGMEDDEGACAAVGGIIADELSEDVLAKVFETRRHLPDWATLRLVSKRWNATVNSCADRVSVKLTAAEWRAELAKEAEEWAAHQPGAELAFARLCYVLEAFPAAVVDVGHPSLAEPILEQIEASSSGSAAVRLVSSHGIDVQVAWSIVAIRKNCEFARAVKLLVPHLCGVWMRSGLCLRLQMLLPAAAQLEFVDSINMVEPEDFSLLGQFHMLKELHLMTGHPVQLTELLPRLHTLSLTHAGIWSMWSEHKLQCLVS
eukprot:jgi/Astpho2/6748/fgenesh1_pg.00102_%23_26_t